MIAAELDLSKLDEWREIHKTAERLRLTASGRMLGPGLGQRAAGPMRLLARLWPAWALSVNRSRRRPNRRASGPLPPWLISAGDKWLACRRARITSRRPGPG
jgi:hypothetical protein